MVWTYCGSAPSKYKYNSVLWYNVLTILTQHKFDGMTNESWSAKWRILYEKWHLELMILVWHIKVDLKVTKRVWQMTPWVDDFQTVWLLTPHPFLPSSLPSFCWLLGLLLLLKSSLLSSLVAVLASSIFSGIFILTRQEQLSQLREWAKKQKSHYLMHS